MHPGREADGAVDLKRLKMDLDQQSARKLAQANLRAAEQNKVRMKKQQKKQQESRLQLKRVAHYLSPNYLNSLLPAHQGLDLHTLTLRDGANGSSEKELPIYFVCIDVEAFEHDQRCVTEIGISTLDTRDLVGTTGRVGNAGWGEKINSKHFCINEYRHIRNKVFVQGCPGNFHFGKSEWINEADASAAVKNCLGPPLDSRGGASVVLVAHDIEADVKYLRSIGLDPLTLVNDSIDTANLFRTLHRQSKSTGLASILLDLGIAAKHLHNAGNDARYTLQALLTIAYVDANKQKSAAAWKDVLESRVQIAIKEAEIRVREEFAGWESGEGEDLILNTSLHKVLYAKSTAIAARAGSDFDNPTVGSLTLFGANTNSTRRPRSGFNIPNFPPSWSLLPRDGFAALGPDYQPIDQELGNRSLEPHVHRGDSVPPSRPPRGFFGVRGRGIGAERGTGRGTGAGVGRGTGPGPGPGPGRGSGQGRGSGGYPPVTYIDYADPRPI